MEQNDTKEAQEQRSGGFWAESPFNKLGFTNEEKARLFGSQQMPHDLPKG